MGSTWLLFRTERLPGSLLVVSTVRVAVVIDCEISYYLQIRFTVAKGSDTITKINWKCNCHYTIALRCIMTVLLYCECISAANDKGHLTHFFTESWLLYWETVGAFMHHPGEQCGGLPGLWRAWRGIQIQCGRCRHWNAASRTGSQGGYGWATISGVCVSTTMPCPRWQTRAVVPKLWGSLGTMPWCTPRGVIGCHHLGLCEAMQDLVQSKMVAPGKRKLQKKGVVMMLQLGTTELWRRAVSQWNSTWRWSQYPFVHHH